MNTSTPTIALLLDHFLGDYQAVVRDAVEIAAKEKGINYLCVIGRPIDSPYKYEEVQNEVFNYLSSQSVSGLVVTGATLSIYSGTDRISEICKRFAPLPVCNVGLSIDGVPSVVVDNHQISSAVHHLAKEHQCRNFAYIGGPSANDEARQRRIGFMSALLELGIPFNKQLEKIGRFTRQSGCEATAELLETGEKMDAIVCANDTMALGAISVLQKNGIDVPNDVRVTGFDDIPSARCHSPRLTTVRQPLEEMGMHAVELLLRQIAGESVPLVSKIRPPLIRRQSCGCTRGRRKHFHTQNFVSLTGPDLSKSIRERREELENSLAENIQIPRTAFGRWGTRLIDALLNEVEGQRGSFVAVLENILATAEYRLWLIDELQNVVTVIREQCRGADLDNRLDLESVWHEARVVLSDAATFAQMKNEVAADLSSTLFLRRTADDLPMRLTKSALVKAITGEFETIGVENGLVSVFPGESEEELECIVAIRDGAFVPLDNERYNTRTIVPSFLKSDERMSYVVMLLSSGDDRLGIMVLQFGAADIYYEILRGHMSSYLKSISFFQDRMKEFQAEADRHRQELEMQHRQKLESLGVLAGGIAHDFNNMLSAMVGNLDVALFDLENKELRPEPILECKTVVKHASGLCRQLLAYSGKGQFLIKRVNLNRLVRELDDLLSVTISKSVKLIFALDGELPDIEGDLAQLTQIFVNLVINASEAIEPDAGTITVSTRTQRCDEAYLGSNISGTDLKPGKYVIAGVSDTGSGIKIEQLAQIFDPFFTTKFTGRGLGLAAVLGIVRGHRGAIKVLSNPKGTRFELVFPMLPKLSDSPQVASSPPLWMGHGTILIVDDEPTVLRAGVRLLERLGFSVLTASNGQEGIEVFQDLEDAISCVILDITMPGLGGVATMIEMKKINTEIPIILTSGYSEEQAIDSDSEGVPAAFIQKPYDFNSLSAVLQKVLGIHSKS